MHSPENVRAHEKEMPTSEASALPLHESRKHDQIVHGSTNSTRPKVISVPWI